MKWTPFPPPRHKGIPAAAAAQTLNASLCVVVPSNGREGLMAGAWRAARSGSSHWRYVSLAVVVPSNLVFGLVKGFWEAPTARSVRGQRPSPFALWSPPPSRSRRSPALPAQAPGRCALFCFCCVGKHRTSFRFAARHPSSPGLAGDGTPGMPSPFDKLRICPADCQSTTTSPLPACGWGATLGPK